MSKIGSLLFQQKLNKKLLHRIKRSYVYIIPHNHYCRMLHMRFFHNGFLSLHALYDHPFHMISFSLLILLYHFTWKADRHLKSSALETQLVVPTLKLNPTLVEKYNFMLHEEFDKHCIDHVIDRRLIFDFDCYQKLTYLWDHYIYNLAKLQIHTHAYFAMKGSGIPPATPITSMFGTY